MVQLKGLIPIGGIIQWSGAIVDIDPDWHLCDGTEGTPNLLDRSVVGAGGIYGVGDTGGALTHEHTFTGDSHFHTSQNGVDVSESGEGQAWDMLNGNDKTTTVQVTGSVGTGDNISPFYALAFIMRLT